MNAVTWTLRVTTTDDNEARVSVRRHQFVVGRPLDFDRESPHLSALEYALGAVGAEIAGGLRAFASRRRLALDSVEAVVNAEVEGPLAYLEVVGEAGPPRIARVHVKLYVASPEDEPTVRTVLDEALERLPIVSTLRPLVRLDVDLTMTA